MTCTEPCVFMYKFGRTKPASKAKYLDFIMPQKYVDVDDILLKLEFELDLVVIDRNIAAQLYESLDGSSISAPVLEHFMKFVKYPHR